MCFHHDVAAYFVIRRLHTANVSFKNVQENQHHHVEKDRQKKLHDLEDISIDRVIEHHRKNSWIHHEQEDFVNNEDVSIIVRHVHEMSKESINWNDFETFHRTIHIVWKQKTNRMITLLNLNVTSVFDTMSHVKWIHDMKKKKFSSWIIDWINNFLFDRFTTFAMNRTMIESFSMQIEISQNSSFFSILYLFYNVDLLKMCNKLETNTKFLEYVDDVNILIYEKNIDENCRNLEKMHKLCERWAIRHKFVFVLIKYELIHFIKNSKKFDMTITIKINSNTIQSRIDIRIFDVQIDTRLKWDSHVQKIQEKMTKQIMIFTKLSIFIWKAIFCKTRMLYIFVVRSILIYDVFVWHMFKNKKSRMINKFAIIQNRYLRSIFESLKKEMNWICVFHVRFDFDSDRSRQQKASQITRSTEKNREFSNDSNSHRENRFCEFSSSSSDFRREVDFLSMQLKQLNDKTCHNVLLVNERSKSIV